MYIDTLLFFCATNVVICMIIIYYMYYIMYDNAYVDINLLIATLKPQSNRPSYSNIVIGTLLHWPLMGGLLHLVQREGAWAGCGSPPINGQCTNFVLFDVAYYFDVAL